MPSALKKTNTVIHTVLAGAQGKNHLSDEMLREGHEPSELRSDLQDESKTILAKKQLKESQQ